MNQSRVNSPSPGSALNKRAQLSSSPSLTMSKSKVILPSRYAQEKRLQKSGFQDILNSIQSTSKMQPLVDRGEASPKKIKLVNHADMVLLQQGLRKNKKTQFKSKPLKREESDQQHYNQIFLNPRQQALQQLKKMSKTQENKKTISKEYQKLLKFESGQIQNQSVKQTIPQQDINESYKECIEMLDAGDLFGLHIQTNQDDFYQDPISIEPPDYPNGHSPSPLQASSGYAPSIPTNIKGAKQSNIKQLLMRAKAGANTDDLEKQAHLSYFLGQVYVQKKKYQQALKFFRRFLGFAKAMQDKIGMCLGANRVGICYYKCGQIQKGVVFHNQNLKLSDNENCFVAFYNLGICYRKQKKFQQAIQYFLSALSWSQEKGQQESECISYGQLAVTYQAMQLYQQSLENYQKSLQICQRTKKNQLRLHNLRAILRIASQFELKSLSSLHQIAERAYQCSKIVGPGIKLQDILRCNIGILKGIQQFHQTKQQYENAQEIQQITESNYQN